MITEDYVSFETAKLLKEKGFDESISMVYMSYGDLCKCNRYDSIRNSDYNDITKNYFEYTAPTLQMAMKWLREKGIYITIIYGDYPSLNKVFWTPQIDSLEGFNLPDSFYKEYDKYEEACEAAIKYCLENLI